MSLLFFLCRGDLRNVFDGYALPGVGFDVVPVLRQFGQFNIPDEAVIHRYALCSAFANAFRLVNVDVVDQLLKQRACKHLHFKESTDRRYELFLPELEFIGFGERKISLSPSHKEQCEKRKLFLTYDDFFKIFFGKEKARRFLPGQKKKNGAGF